MDTTPIQVVYRYGHLDAMRDHYLRQEGYDNDDDDILAQDALRSIDELSNIPWEQFHHAYGLALDLPQTLLSLFQARNDATRVEQLLSFLSGSIIHQGTLYDAALPAVPFLADMAARFETQQTRLEVLRFLITLALSSRTGNEPLVGRHVARSTFPLLRMLRFNAIEPSVQNVNLCFLIIAAPPPRESDKVRVSAMLSANRYSGHPRFHQLVNHAVQSIRNNGALDVADLADLESEVLDRAEDWDSQAEERRRLLALCGRPYSKPIPLPLDVLRRIKGFLYMAVAV